MKIQHVIFSAFEHILVVDGERSELSRLPLVSHPCGLVAYHPDAYGTPADLKGRVFQALQIDQVETIMDTACEPAQEAFRTWMEVNKTCLEVKLARYGAEGSAA